jgi:hypothetical protein
MKRFCRGVAALLLLALAAGVGTAGAQTAQTVPAKGPVQVTYYFLPG